MAAADERHPASKDAAGAIEHAYRRMTAGRLTDSLRLLLGTYVDAMRAEGEPLSRIVAKLQQIGHRGSVIRLAYASPRAGNTLNRNDAVVREAVSFCVRR